MFSHTIATAFLAIAIMTSVSAAPAAPGTLQRRIAEDPILACGPPNNDDHKEGDMCAFKVDGGVVNGSEAYLHFFLICELTAVLRMPHKDT